MMYIIYNDDGSIKEKNLNEFIQQGDNLTKKIGIVIEGYEPTDYTLLATFKLPNGETTVLTSNDVEDIEGTEYQGVVITLTESETALAGVVRMNIQALNGDDEVLVSYSVYLPINEGDNPGTVAMMSIESYQLLLEKFNDYTKTEDLGDTFEVLSNKVSSISAESTDAQYPTAKLLYDQLALKEDVANKVTSISNSSTDTEYPSAKCVYDNETALSTRITNMENLGRFLSLWNATTGEATSNPPTSPYAYKTGDYFRVSVAGTRIADGSSYTIGGTNYTTSEVTLGVGDVIYYDGTNWQIQLSGTGGNVVDVQVDGTSIVAAGIANIQSGSIASENAGFVTGGAVYSALPHLYMHIIRFQISNGTKLQFHFYSHDSTEYTTKYQVANAVGASAGVSTTALPIFTCTGYDSYGIIAAKVIIKKAVFGLTGVFDTDYYNTSLTRITDDDFSDSVTFISDTVKEIQ